MADKQKTRTLAKTTLDVSRQAIAIVPILILYLLSREKIYLDVALVTSATTLASACVLLGINFVVMLRNRKSHIDIAAGYLISISPFAGCIAFALIGLSGHVFQLSLLTIWLLVTSEVVFALIQQTLSRYALAEWKIAPLLLANVISPVVRALLLVSLALFPGAEVFAAGYLIAQLIFSALIMRECSITLVFGFRTDRGFIQMIKIGLPNWLSSLGVTAMDNLAVIFIIQIFDPALAATIILMLRVYGAAGTPVQSVAALRLTSQPTSAKRELQSATVLGVGAALFGYISLICLDMLFPAGNSHFYILGLTLFAFPLLRALSSFLGNFFTVIGSPWIRVWGSMIGVMVLVCTFMYSKLFQSSERGVGDAALPILAAEISLLVILLISIPKGSKTI